jgi:hypothetical protein
MQIRLYRKPGFFGSLVALDVRVNGRSAASIKSKEEFVLQLPGDSATLQVAMGNACSQVLELSRSDADIEIECGPRLWVLFDLLSFAFVAPFCNHVFYLRELDSA